MKLLTIALASLCMSACALDADPQPGAADTEFEHLATTAQQATVITCTDLAFTFFRYFSPAGTDHFYTANFGELGNGAGGYVLEGSAGKVFSSTFAACGAVPLLRFFNVAGSDHFYTTNAGEGAGLRAEGVAGYCFPFNVAGLVPLYRYFSPGAFDHLYTTNFGELGNGAGGYRLEGIQCFVAP